MMHFTSISYWLIATRYLIPVRCTFVGNLIFPATNIIVRCPFVHLKLKFSDHRVCLPLTALLFHYQLQPTSYQLISLCTYRFALCPLLRAINYFALIASRFCTLHFAFSIFPYQLWATSFFALTALPYAFFLRSSRVWF